MRSLEQIKKDFLEDLNSWQNTVYEYDLHDLQEQPESNQWSIGQVINHIIEVTDWYVEQARKALVDTQNIRKSKSKTITEWFAANSFADGRFKRPDDTEPSQPKSINELIDKLERLKSDVLQMTDTISKSNSKGKSKHPGHQFLTAHEWFQFAEMHCRHHFRQKERIAAKIKKTNR